MTDDFTSTRAAGLELEAEVRRRVKATLDDREDRRRVRFLTVVAVLSALVLALFIGGVVWNVRTGDAAKAHTRLECIERGGTWIPDNCVMPR